MTPIPAPLESGEAPLSHEGKCFVYHAYGRHDQLLYIGITEDLCERLTHHARYSRAWWWKVQRVTWDRYASRTQAERTERRLIAELMPLHNRTFNWRREVADQMGHQRPYDSAAWRRLGEVVRAERGAKRRTQTNVAADAGIKVAAWRALEAGDFTEWAVEVLDRVEDVLGWHRGSVESVLAGGEPDRLTDEEMLRRALERQRLASLGDRV